MTCGMASRASLRTAALVLCAPPVAGCAHSLLVAPLTPPAKGGAEWTEVTSPHFVVRTDLSPGKATGLCDELERIDAAARRFGRAARVRPSAGARAGGLVRPSR